MLHYLKLLFLYCRRVIFLIMMHLKPGLIFFLFFVLSACSSENAGSNPESAKVNEETLTLETEVLSILGSLEQIVARDSTRAGYRADLESLAREVRAWESSLVIAKEDADEHHGHAHLVKPELSEEQLQRMQADMLKKLNDISDRLVLLMDQMSK